MTTTTGAQMRMHILGVARPIILRKGFSGVGLNEILGAAGIPKGSFYHYFGSKEAFGEALLEVYFEQYAQHLDHTLQHAEGTAADRLMRYWRNWLDTQCGDDPQGKCLAVKLGAEVADLSEPMRAVLQRGTQGIIARVTAGIEAALEDGSLRGIEDPAETARALYGMWLGATLLDKIHRDGQSLRIAMRNTRRLLGLAAEPA
ncbi:MULTISPECIES: TetR/AcrR family transcriptional regulator [Burkholderia]|uniref:TetR/AcrR family transcriptional regulator n=1 Tax=Burkholderia TaxID=32008 RepID=UPI00050E5737|nr:MULTISPECIES: TetR/AcrR family transcriptional regulator [Burkholderia]KGE09417.1 TetR family transcriptional regulator [Burkholderia gladioli]KVM60903.1 TetR family transcriptional regulator [Burkholderia gladioli]NBI47612.1 TetR/AcrR family transcriptional regulator [Burkholderia sp. ISTR5]